MYVNRKKKPGDGGEKKSTVYKKNQNNELDDGRFACH